MPVKEHNVVYSVGHSNHSEEEFLRLLELHSIEVVADVRSSPFSRRLPHFNSTVLKESLKKHGIKYVFLGEELGARPKDESCYIDGSVDYDRLASTDSFHQGIDRIHEGVNQYRIAIMCAEKEPLDCHRTILVSRWLLKKGLQVKHILADGSLEEHEDTLKRLLKMTGQEPLPLLASLEDPQAAIEKAYTLRGQKLSHAGARKTDAEDEV